ncbi:hypothetical protein BZARG_2528 [Bizionia argentinensis JUB59]|uniref:Signal transduction histidine kinase internal region domain-containing protein n=1 Tax=Bizionia argentinensis JUB59 TaxID=1046627 RepID=G2EFP6_9FLAO|nr:histidine kinase [Bizionia argentinensis]EGV42770.2 hypothetical protein BZARG_2528 [Bizionia argentinensis JUB59]
MKHKSPLFFVIFICSVAFSQQYINYSTKDGLPSNHVYKIAQDVKGFLWFATDKGLVKYNGNTMKTFTTKDGLAVNDVWDMYPTPDGKLWYLSKASKLGYIENDSVFAFESEQKGEVFNPIFTSQIGNDILLTSSLRFHVFKDNIWKTLENYPIKGTVPHSYIQHHSVSNFKTTAKYDSITVLDINNKPVKTFDFTDRLDKIHKRGQITDSLFFWVDTKKYAILNLNTLQLHKRNFSDEIGLAEVKHARINLVNNELQISGEGFIGVLDSDFNISKTFYIPEYFEAHFGFIDSSGAIWLTTFTNGIYYLPIEKQNVTYCLPSQKITSISNVNNKIIANVFNKGFYKYNDSTSTFSPFINEDEYVYGSTYIEALQTEYYLSVSNITAFKNNKAKYFSFLDRKFSVNDKARQLVFFNNDLYGAYSLGINKINASNFEIEAHYQQSAINQLFIFNNHFLVATTNGLMYFKDEKFNTIAFNKQPFNKPVLSIAKLSNSEILINTDGFGAYVSNLETIELLPDSDFLIVNKAFIEGNTIWLATESGIVKYTKLDEKYTLQMYITINNGLPSNNITDVFIQGNKLIAGTNNGIAILPKNQNVSTQLLDIYIEDAFYNSEPIVSSNSAFKYESNNNINIKISSIDFSENRKDVSYNYKLEPIQKEWISSTTINLNFNNLQPETYNLLIEANGIKKQLVFVIEPLWWQKLWFKGLAILLAIYIVALISRYFVKRSQLKKNQKIFEDQRLSELQLKALRSQMNPHFVFNSLSAIQYYIGENNFATSELYLVKFSKLIRQFFELSKENEISLEREVELLKNYLEIEKLRFKEKLNFVIQVEPDMDLKTTEIPTMLLQPIVENAVNHGVFNKMENGLITINFKYIDEQTFMVEVIDDGVGFVNTKKRVTGKVKSSNVLKDRLHFLNQSNKWEIGYKNQELHPEKPDKGNKSVFLIKKNLK